MGDVIHTLPALTDAVHALNHISFDWVVEPGFAEVPTWHPAVEKVIPFAFRKWRKSPWQCIKQKEGQRFVNELRKTHYDLVIDAQGLIKSALITRLAVGKRVGLNRNSAREGLASLAYDRKINVPKGQHAVQRIRQLFAQALEYPESMTPPDYGIEKSRLAPLSYGEKSLIFLHGTTWTTKHWPESYWQELAYLALKAGFEILLPWGNEIEQQRARSIRAFCEQKGSANLPQILPKLSLAEVTSLIAKAKGIVAVDTGLGHMAAAMAIPTVSLYGPTDPGLTGAYGPSQTHLKSSFSCSPCLGRECKLGQNFEINPPCFSSLPPEAVLQTLVKKIEDNAVK
jgi:heptosyltransferase I